MIFSTLLAQADESVFGKVQPPPGVAAFDERAGGGDAIGIINFFSTLLQVATVIAGLWVMMQFILAGYDYIVSSGDTGSHNRVKDRLTMSIIGLVLIVTSYAVAGLIGLILFGDASYIINPQLEGIGIGS